MAFENAGCGTLDYLPCRYGKSKLLFRGPRRRLDGVFCAAMGGTETYGKFVEDPWPALLEARIGLPVVNFGYLNAGVDVFAHEPQVTDVSRKACLSIIQLMDAHNMSNRFYAVHPRRNDRFLRASSLMRSVFPEIDFTEFNFTRHMLNALRLRAPDRYEMLVKELRTAWVARMAMLLNRVEGRKILLWIGDYTRAPDGDEGAAQSLLTPQMVEQVRPNADALVFVQPSDSARAAGTEGMHFGPLEAAAAAEMPGPMVHMEIAAALEPAVRSMIPAA